MKLYDIISVEDDGDAKEIMEMCAKEESLSHLSVGALEELEDIIMSYSAKFYVVDSHFPFSKGGKNEFLAKEAITMIQKHHSEAKIILYASPQLKDFARENKVGYENKAEVIRTDIVRNIKFLVKK